MGLFNTSRTNDFAWTSIQSVAQWEAIYNEPSEQLKVIFKHSTRCSISSFALSSFEKEMQDYKGVSFYFVDLIAHRDVSNKIAEDTGVIHQSPQVIVLHNQHVVYSASHEAIDGIKIQQLNTTIHEK